MINSPKTFEQLMDKFTEQSIKIFDDKITIESLKSRKRTRSLSDIRHTLMYIAYADSEKTQDEVAKYFKRDHAMVIHSRKVVDELKFNNKNDYLIRFNKVKKISGKIFKGHRESRDNVFITLLKSKVKSQRAIDFWVKRYNEAY